MRHVIDDRPAVIAADALRKSDRAAEQHDVPVTGQTTQIAKKLQEHLQLAALHHRYPWQQTRLIVWQHVTQTLCDVKTGTCQITNRTFDWLMARERIKRPINTTADYDPRSIH